MNKFVSISIINDPIKTDEINRYRQKLMIAHKFALLCDVALKWKTALRVGVYLSLFLFVFKYIPISLVLAMFSLYLATHIAQSIKQKVICHVAGQGVTLERMLEITSYLDPHEHSLLCEKYRKCCDNQTVKAFQQKLNFMGRAPLVAECVKAIDFVNEASKARDEAQKAFKDIISM